MKYKVFNKNHETRGGTILPYKDSLNLKNYADIFARHGLAKVDARKWYPMSQLVDVFNEMADTSGMMDFVSLGMKMGENVPLPPELANMSFFDLVNGLEQTYNHNHRGSDIGYIRGEVVNNNHVIAHYRTPYPDDLLYGSMYGYARKFLPKGTKITVKYDERSKRMEQSGRETVIHVTW